MERLPVALGCGPIESCVKQKEKSVETRLECIRPCRGLAKTTATSTQGPSLAGTRACMHAGDYRGAGGAYVALVFLLIQN